MLSAVVPTLDAAPGILGCLEALAQADEVVVVDGGSSDDTREMAAAAGARVVTAPAGRGVQLVAGGVSARGDWLFFVHADSRPGPGWREAAERHMARHPGKAAFLRFRLDEPAWQARLIERGVALRARLLGLPYGDQGLLVPRALYEAAGGYRPMPLMEDVDLVRRIGRRRLRPLDSVMTTDASRWRRDGWLARSARNLLCLALWGAGVEPERIARLYEARRVSSDSPRP